MKQKNKFKMNIKSESGFTMQDLVAAMALFTIFVGVICTLMYNALHLNIQSRMLGRVVNYSIQMLEDMDKIAYEDVKPTLADTYKSKFNVPDKYQVNIEVSNYNNETDEKAVIKIVKLTISYTLKGKTENFVVEKLKVKEV